MAVENKDDLVTASVVYFQSSEAPVQKLPQRLTSDESHHWKGNGSILDGSVSLLDYPHAYRKWGVRVKTVRSVPDSKLSDGRPGNPMATTLFASGFALAQSAP